MRPRPAELAGPRAEATSHLAMLSQQTLHEALAPARTGVRCALALTAAAALIALVTGGAAESAAVIIGGGTALLGGLSMARGVAAAFGRAEDARGARNRTLASALLRYPLLAGVLALALVVLGLPAEWLAVGLTTWPVALIAATVHAQALTPAHPRG